MGGKGVVDAGEGHLVVGKGHDAGILFLHEHLQTGQSLAVAVVVGGSQGVQLGSLLVQALLKSDYFGLLGREFGIQFLQLGIAHLRFHP